MNVYTGGNIGQGADGMGRGIGYRKRSILHILIDIGLKLLILSCYPSLEHRLETKWTPTRSVVSLIDYSLPSARQTKMVTEQNAARFHSRNALCLSM